MDDKVRELLLNHVQYSGVGVQHLRLRMVLEIEAGPADGPGTVRERVPIGEVLHVVLPVWPGMP